MSIVTPDNGETICKTADVAHTSPCLLSRYSTDPAWYEMRFDAEARSRSQRLVLTTYNFYYRYDARSFPFPGCRRLANQSSRHL